jgi:hypothetical protein
LPSSSERLFGERILKKTATANDNCGRYQPGAYQQSETLGQHTLEVWTYRISMLLVPPTVIPFPHFAVLQTHSLSFAGVQ